MEERPLLVQSREAASPEETDERLQLRIYDTLNRLMVESAIARARQKMWNNFEFQHLSRASKRDQRPWELLTIPR